MMQQNVVLTLTREASEDFAPKEIGRYFEHSILPNIKEYMKDNPDMDSFEMTVFFREHVVEDRN